MIEWMQRHRKYLVITIWISTIAFVGAGFVGWGAYSFNSSSTSSVAKVGNINISVSEFQNAYSNTYAYYNNLLNNELTQEKAQQMGLENLTMQNVIDQALFLNFANEIGLTTLDDEIKEKLANDPVFQVDGVFNLNQYNNILANIRQTPAEYEKSLAKSILLQKLIDIITLKPNNELIDLLGSTMFMEDKVGLKVLHVNEDEITINEDELKKFWGKIKNDFQTKKSYIIKTYSISSKNESFTSEELEKFYDEQKFNFIDDEGKIKALKDAKDEVAKALLNKKSKQTALKEYLNIKNNEQNLTNEITIQEDTSGYPTEFLASANPNDTLKPYATQDGWIIVKLVKTILPTTMSYEQAREHVLPIYKNDQARNLLTQKATNMLKDNNYKAQTYNISRDMKTAIVGLSLEQTQQFANNLFNNSNGGNGYVILGDKAVVYNILEQKLLDNNKVSEYNSQLTQMASSLQNNELQANLLAELKKRYKIQIFNKGH